MKRYLKIPWIILAVCMLCSCSRIPDYSESSDSLFDDDDSDSTDKTTDMFNESDVRGFEILKRDFITKLNAEGGSYDGVVLEDGKFDGSGYLRLNTNQILKHIVNANTSQHYRIILAARSMEGASITLRINDKVCGFYYINKYDEYENSEYEFELYAADILYLEAGQNILQFSVGSGSAEIDYIVVENADAVDDSCYKVNSGFASPNLSASAAGAMSYLSEIYGSATLTAQNVTFGTNAEIDEIHISTGRYPAIRISELADADPDDETTKEEIELALDWGKNGGIQSYVWHWYSPNYKHSVQSNAFDIAEAFDGQMPDEIAMFDDETLQMHIDSGFLSSDMVSLINDVDKIAAVLKPLNEANVTVLFQPLPDPDAGLYWWGDREEDYIGLWQFVFDRLCSYHKLKNLIWVWNGSDSSFYPGGSCVDIVGQSFYENSNASFAGRFSAVSSITSATKMLGITFCDVLPSIDYMSRDNALWLFAAAGNGSYILDSTGELSETFNKQTALRSFYNNKLTITRDELPDFSEYAYN